MRLSEFIRAEMEAILKDWEKFARTLRSAEDMEKLGLRDHAKEMLETIADDLNTPQTESEQEAKSKGTAPAVSWKTWAEVHGNDRQTSGFSVKETVSEFRALRASVVSLWTKAYPTISGYQLEDLTRFHESIDQAVAESLENYTIIKERDTRLFGAVLLASPDPIYVIDLKGRFVYANKATADLFAMRLGEIIGKTPFELGFPFASDFQHNLEKVMANQSTYRDKFTHTFASGKGERFEYLLAPVLDEAEKTEAIVCISRDITEQELAAEKIWHSAHHDLLTSLPNRRLFLDRLEQEVKHAKRRDLPLAVLFMDLDGFKAVNDTLGHNAGDQLLTDVAKRLTACVREEDTVARIGGDEFTVIVSSVKQRSDVKHVAQTIIDALAKPFQIAQQPVTISVSVGIAFYPEDAAFPTDLLHAADHAMYIAKNAGANQMIFFNNTFDKPEHKVV